MRTEEENKKLAELLYPNIKDTREDVMKKYPKRELEEGAMVTRFAPSPTGFLHMGGVYSSLVSTMMATQTNGVSILRIEDTDKGREVENGISLILGGLNGLGIHFTEGVTGEDTDTGEYGPYVQSKRLPIYHTFIKEMIANGYAYPCFMTEKELNDIRDKQLALGVKTGCYGDWAKWRNASLDEIKAMFDKGSPYVIRLRSTGDANKTYDMVDLVKGKVTLRENDMDAVLIKSDGFPVYHFAHPVDDTLMCVTHVVRGDEWFSSLPLHVELFNKLGFELPQYCHIAPLMKIDGDDNSKRKLSKRKDPEADVQFYVKNGYPKEGVIEYLLNLANSNFYDWRKANPDASPFDFTLCFEKFNKAGALFDIVKLDNACKDYWATLSAEEIYDRVVEWSSIYDKELNSLLLENKDYCTAILNIERTGDKIRKDIVKLADVKDLMSIFFDISSHEDITSRVSTDMQKNLLQEYISTYEDSVDSVTWFDNVKNIAAKYNVSAGDVAMTIRVAISGRTKSPDLYQIIHVLGEKEMRNRLALYLKKL